MSEYMSDNGSAFTSAGYTNHLQELAQISHYAGVGAHHHNGVAERSIQTIMSIARTMMLHQAIHWPDVAMPTLWPLAVDHAVYLFNHMPNVATGLSPHDMLSRSRWPQSQLADVHVWGCPVYVLDKKMQDGKKLPRWQPRSTRQIYVGMSKRHASSVPLCLHPATGAITPQFHIVFDDTFSTIATSIENLPDFNSDEWVKLFGDSSYQYVLDDVDPSTAPDSSNDAPPPNIGRVRDRLELLQPPTPLPVTPPPTKLIDASPLQPPKQRETSVENPMPSTPRTPSATPSPSQRENVPTTTPQVPPAAAPTAPPPSKPASKPPQPSKPTPPRRSGRSNKGQAPHRHGYDGSGPAGYNANTCGCNNPSCFHAETYHQHSFCDYFSAFFTCFNTEWEYSYDLPFLQSAYKVRAVKDPDLLSYQEAMNSPDKDRWSEAAKKEIEELEGKTTWKEVPMSEAKSKIIPGTWVFRVKRTPSGEIKKYKARYCVRGDLEDEQAKGDTFAPTVAWSTVRLFLVLCLILGWSTVSVDFSNAFVQGVLKEPKWIHMPQGFVSGQGPGTCLRLIKSLYGLSESPKIWSNTAIEGFKKCGFKQSAFDPCLLYKKGMMVVLYVDDAGIGAQNPDDIDALIEQLRDLGFELKKEGNFTEFLGINLETLEDGSIELTQTGLIDKILQATKMTDCNPNRVPATGALGTDPDGEPMDEEWNYRSVVGMLLYLSTITRPDITFAVSQVARFSANLKQSHATAVKTILRYLKRTRTKGMIIKPVRNM